MPSLLDIKILQIIKLSFVWGWGYCCIAFKYMYHNKYNKKIPIYPGEENRKELFCGKYTGELWAMKCLAQDWHSAVTLPHQKHKFSTSVQDTTRMCWWRGLITSQIGAHQWWFRVLYKHILFKFGRGFIRNGSRLYTLFHFLRFCGYFGGVFRSVKV